MKYIVESYSDNTGETYIEEFDISQLITTIGKTIWMFNFAETEHDPNPTRDIYTFNYNTILRRSANVLDFRLALGKMLNSLIVKREKIAFEWDSSEETYRILDVRETEIAA